jgi:hypothetical protein
MTMPAGFPALSLVAILTGAVLAGCSSSESDADRNAAVTSKETRVCVVNDSPSRTELEFLSADDVTGETILWENMGDKGCATGGGDMNRTDVAIGMNTNDPYALWIITAGNPAFGSPGIKVQRQIDRTLYDCINDAFGEGESRSFDNGFVTITTKRLPDTDEKNFEVRISASTDPSSPGENREIQKCRKQLR